MLIVLNGYSQKRVINNSIDKNYQDDIYKYFDEYFANFEKENNITIISQNNRDELDSIINNLEQMIVKYDKIMETKKYIILQKINTYQNMIADYNIECLKSSELSFDEFITRKTRIQLVP